MNKITKLWLLYSGVGLALSLAIISLFDVLTDIRFISNEGIIFGVMFAAMGSALKSYSGQKVSEKATNKKSIHTEAK